jgi:hypothetical protein
MAAVGWVTFGLTTMVGLTLLRGALLQLLWGWFVVPVFHLPSLSLVQALGIALVVTFLMYQDPQTDAIQDRRSAVEKAVTIYIKAAVLYSFWFVAAVLIHAFA